MYLIQHSPNSLDSETFLFFFLNLFNVYLFLRERETEPQWGRDREKEGDRESEAGSESDVAFESTNCEIMI